MLQSAEFSVDAGAFRYDQSPEHIPGLSAQTGPAPCDRCPSRKSCAAGLACPDFSAFVFNGKLVDSDRKPSGNVYQQVFAEPRPSSEMMAPQVLGLVASGFSYRRIAKQLNMSKDTVLDIVKRDRAKRASLAHAEAVPALAAGFE